MAWTYQQSPEALDVTQGQGDVHKHNDVTKNDGVDVAVALSVYFIFNTPLGTEGYRQVGVCVVLHKPYKPEMDKKHHQHACLLKVRAVSHGFWNQISLFLPCQSFPQLGGIVVVVEWKGDHQSGGVVVVCVCNKQRAHGFHYLNNSFFPPYPCPIK